MKAGNMTCKRMVCSLLSDDRTTIVLILSSIVYFVVPQITFIQGFVFIVKMMCVQFVHGWKTGYLDTKQHRHHKTQRCNLRQEKASHKPTPQKKSHT